VGLRHSGQDLKDNRLVRINREHFTNLILVARPLHRHAANGLPETRLQQRPELPYPVEFRIEPTPDELRLRRQHQGCGFGVYRLPGVAGGCGFGVYRLPGVAGMGRQSNNGTGVDDFAGFLVNPGAVEAAEGKSLAGGLDAVVAALPLGSGAFDKIAGRHQAAAFAVRQVAGAAFLIQLVGTGVEGGVSRWPKSPLLALQQEPPERLSYLGPQVTDDDVDGGRRAAAGIVAQPRQQVVHAEDGKQRPGQGRVGDIAYPAAHDP